MWTINQRYPAIIFIIILFEGTIKFVRVRRTPGLNVSVDLGDAQSFGIKVGLSQ